MVDQTDESTLTHVEYQLGGDPSAVRTARRLVADQLRCAARFRPYLAGVVDTAVLVASELVTDAVSSGSGDVSLQLEVGTDRVEVSVLDDVPQPGSQSRDRAAATAARLDVVAAVATTWGVRILPYRRWRWARLSVSRTGH